MSSSSSKRRQAASRANGKKSRGPVTPEGKAKAAANATKHGLSSQSSPTVLPADPNTARAVCLRNESRAEFVHFHQTFVDELKPTTPIEAMLVEELAILRWRLHRAWHFETALLDNEMDHMDTEVANTYETMDQSTRATLAFRSIAENSPSFALLNRYESRLSRQWDRCFSRLAALRQERAEPPLLPNEPNPKNGHSPGAPEPSAAATTADGCGSATNSSVDPEPEPEPRSQLRNHTDPLQTPLSQLPAWNEYMQRVKNLVEETYPDVRGPVFELLEEANRHGVTGEMEGKRAQPQS